MPVEVRTARSMAEAAGILSADRNARLLSGGTLVMRDINEGRLTEGTIVRLLDPAYDRIETGGGRVEIGAGATMAAILARPELAFLHPTARAVGGPAVRNMATVGGNLFAPSPYGDLAVALLALDAQVLLASGYGQPRATPLEEFLSARDRGGQGLVAAIAFNRLANPADLRFRKMSRVKPKGIAVLSIAAYLPMAGGRVSQARVAYGAMGPAPMRARGVERVLEGRALDNATIAAAKAVAAEGTRPATDAIASDWYRREVLPVHLGRLLAGEA
jgi:CO/xanthine dehydrogenase FAD-binding subunit